MAEELDNDDPDQIASIGKKVMGALGADQVKMTLRNGSEIVGAIVGFMAKRKEKKGEAVWVGNVSVQTKLGVLEVDYLTIQSVEPGAN